MQMKTKQSFSQPDIYGFLNSAYRIPLPKSGLSHFFCSHSLLPQVNHSYLHSYFRCPWESLLEYPLGTTEMDMPDLAG